MLRKMLIITSGGATCLVVLLWIASYGIPWNGTIPVGHYGKILSYKDRVVLAFERPNSIFARVLLRHGDAYFLLWRESSNPRAAKHYHVNWFEYGWFYGFSTKAQTAWHWDNDGSRVIRTYNVTHTTLTIRLPFFLLAGLFGAYPMWQLALWNRRIRRRMKGLCVNCAYNLHGLPEPRCPECGTAFVIRGDGWHDQAQDRHAHDDPSIQAARLK